MLFKQISQLEYRSPKLSSFILQRVVYQQKWLNCELIFAWLDLWVAEETSSRWSWMSKNMRSAIRTRKISAIFSLVSRQHCNLGEEPEVPDWLLKNEIFTFFSYTQFRIIFAFNSIAVTLQTLCLYSYSQNLRAGTLESDYRFWILL